jgi:hypothetical protein
LSHKSPGGPHPSLFSCEGWDPQTFLEAVIPRACDFIEFQTLGQCPLRHKSPGAPSFAFFLRRVGSAEPPRSRLYPGGKVTVSTHPPHLSSRANPGFPTTPIKDVHVCGFHQGKPHELCGTRRAQQEIRGSRGICGFSQPTYDAEGGATLPLLARSVEAIMK